MANATIRRQGTIGGPALAVWAVTGLTLVLLLGYVPGAGLAGWSVRAAAMLPFAGAGIVFLTTSGNEDWATRLALAFLGVSALSATLSPAPLASWVGPRGWFTGVAAVGSTTALWALGRTVGSTGRERVAGAVVLGACLNTVAGLFQSLGVLPLHIPDSTHWGRPMALMGNPVYFGALSAAGLALAARRFVDHRNWILGLAVTTLAFGVNLSGGRAAILTGAVGSCLAMRGAPRKWLLVTCACIAAGFASGALLAAPEQSGTARLSDASASGRPVAWRAGVTAAIERPLLGWGPGRFEAEATRRRSLEDRPVEFAPFVDAHSWPIEYAATTGLIGLGLLVAWLAAVAARARGGLAIFALTILANGLLQPASVGLTPLAALAAGLATKGYVLRRSRRVPLLAGTVAGLMAAGLLLSTELSWGQVRPSPAGLEAFDRARATFPDTAELLGEGATAHLQSGRGDEAEKLARMASELDPTLASHALRLAMVLEADGDIVSARAEYERALELDPWSASALRGVGRTTAGIDSARGKAACARLLRLLPKTQCDWNTHEGAE